MEYRSRQLFVLLGVLALLAVSCAVNPVNGPVRTRSDQVSLDGAETVQAEILMGAGKLVIDAGAKQLLEGLFTYSNREFAPEINYRVQSSAVGLLEIKQPEKPGNYISPNFRNDWEIKFNQDVPLELEVTLGAGETMLDLSQLNLVSFTLQMGAGEASVDLDGQYKDDLNIDIQGGVGELTVVLPDDMMIEVQVQGGLGDINTSGLYRDGDFYRGNYSGQGPVLYLSISAGIGELNLLVE